MDMSDLSRGNVPFVLRTFCQGQVSAEGILRVMNPNLGSNSGTRILGPRILGSNSLALCFPIERAPQ